MTSIESVLGRPEFRIRCENLLRSRGAIVYAWMREGRALYVGMSMNGLLRPISASHEVCWAFQPGDDLYVWKARDREHAKQSGADGDRSDWSRLQQPSLGGNSRAEAAEAESIR